MTDPDTAKLIKNNLDLARRYLDSVSHWDFVTMRQVLHPDITVELNWTVEPFPKYTHGLDRLMFYAETAPEFAVAENLYDYDIHVIAGNPNELFMEYKSDMKLKSGREYSNDYIARMTIQDGKIIRFRTWMDSVRLLGALGGSIRLPEVLPDIETAS